MTNNSIGLYIHIPFCKKKCLYCSFYSVKSDEVSETLFLALLEEIQSFRDKHICVDTIFIGGGTPSLLTTSQMERLFEEINRSFNVSGEITIEMNPDSITDDKLITLKSLGVNRISVGVQSLVDEELKAIGRIHNAQVAIDAINTVNKYFDNINIDLMVGLPNQTIESLSYTLNKLFTLNFTHCSVYSLILEENTPLYNLVQNGLILPDSDKSVDMYEFATVELEKHGFYRYEISNFALSGYECKHNSNCWHFHEYIGIGPSSHSYYEDTRFSNPETIEKYLNKDNKTIYPIEDKNTRVGEYIMLALRTREGIDKNDFKQKFGLDFDSVFKNILSNKYINTSCVSTKKRFYIKPEFYYVSNSIIVNMLEAI